ncbi:MAG TPA: hypothetical protein VHB79_02730 [Polyangiaceae bacterium]|nr:hypothetical protein [Polyangiaceae bacterium]
MQLRYLLLVVLASVACGGPILPANQAQQERDQKHCNTGSDCASGFCQAGRCS